MPSNLKRFQTGGSYHFNTFSCYRRLLYLDKDSARIVFEEELESGTQAHFPLSPPVALASPTREIAASSSDLPPLNATIQYPPLPRRVAHI